MVEAMEIPKGFKKTEVGIIPDDWDLYPIEDLTPKNKQYTIVDGPFGSNLKTIHYRKFGIPIITSGYVTDGKFSATEYLYVDLEKFKQEKRSAVRGGDIVMAKIGERCGASAILPKYHPEGILSGNALKITIDENRFSKELIAQILWGHHTKGAFEILRTTGAQPAISMANLKKYKIPLPPTKAEQTAIAEALNDADALITQLEKLIAKKRAIKQGAMQELLKPKEGWEVKAIGEIAIVGRGRVISHKEISKSIEGKYPVYSSQTFNNGVMGYLDSYDFDGEYLTWTTDGVYAGKVYHRNGQFNCTNVCGTIKLKRDYAPFVAYLLDTITPDHVSRNLANPKLMNDPMKRIKIPLPNYEEQTRIAQILSDMDSEIEVLEKKLDKYKMLKQGMMQNLLTGKIRLI